MGRRGSTETTTALLLAFLEQRTWRQSELASRLGIQRKTLVRNLGDLQLAGMKLEREEEHPNVYWSVPKSWFPGAVVFRQAEVANLVTILRRAPASTVREQLLQHIGKSAGELQQSSDREERVITRQLSPEEEAWLAIVQEATDTRVSVRVKYFTASRGDISQRHLSVQRVFVEKHKVIAFCHRDRALKWFCLDRILSAALDPLVTFVEWDVDDVDRHARESVDGYHSGSAPVPCVFRISEPDTRWVKEKLPLACEVESDGKDLIFRATTSGVLPLARFLVGLGSSARVESPELREVVRVLATGALDGTNSADPEAIPERISGARNGRAR